jgi:predicted RNA-binding Zn-ribbon protein involved in translation (DUF1610 family)
VCSAPVPLADRPTVACPHCGVTVAVPTTHADALRAARTAEEARRATEPPWRRLSAPPRRARWLGLVLLVLLPVAATCAGSLVPFPPLARAEVLAVFTLPALLPGAVLALWAEAAAATAVQVRAAMSATPGDHGAPPACRNGSAPLTVEADALAVSCPYCGADNLVVAIRATADRLHARRRHALRTLADALHALRRRRAMIALGMIAAAGLATPHRRHRRLCTRPRRPLHPGRRSAAQQRRRERTIAGADSIEALRQVQPALAPHRGAEADVGEVIPGAEQDRRVGVDACVLGVERRVGIDVER